MALHACSLPLPSPSSPLSSPQQRLRESVRAWLSSSDVRVAKDTLEKARRSIEIQMERFRVVEKDVKGKAHLGLGRDALDPAAAAKQQCADWLTEVMDRLQTEIESCEADVENIGPGGTKAKKARVAELQALIARHQQHVAHLEQTLRLLRNDQVEAEDVEDALKEGLEAYLDSGGEALDPAEDEPLYASLPLEEASACVLGGEEPGGGVLCCGGRRGKLGALFLAGKEWGGDGAWEDCSFCREVEDA